MRGARFLVWLAAPLGLFAFVAAMTLLLSWTKPGGICATWLGPLMGLCT